MTKAILFGSGSRAKGILKWHIQEQDLFEIIGIVDNNKEKQGTMVAGIPVWTPDYLKNITFDKIIICSTYVDDIWKQLKEELNIQDEKIIIPDNIYFFLEKRLKNKYNSYFFSSEDINDPELKSSLEFIAKNSIEMYCNEFIYKYKDREISVYKDEEAKLYYVIENGKRMYFSRKYNNEQSVRRYYNDISMEQDEASPHRYECKQFHINIGDIGVDVGAAEGNFSLSIIDRVSKIYIIEADDDWIEALQYTFAPYMDKVVIMKGMVSNQDNQEYITLDTLFNEIHVDFIKMDIEGYEIKALEGAKQILQSPHLKAAICVYHHDDDNDIIQNILGDYGMDVMNTPGYLLCLGDWEAQNKKFDFRKAIAIGVK